jgi:hypothetical protein
VLDTRQAYQRTMATDLVAIEAILGRNVIVF